MSLSASSQIQEPAHSWPFLQPRGCERERGQCYQWSSCCCSWWWEYQSDQCRRVTFDLWWNCRTRTQHSEDRGLKIIPVTVILVPRLLPTSHVRWKAGRSLGTRLKLTSVSCTAIKPTFQLWIIGWSVGTRSPHVHRKKHHARISYSSLYGFVWQASVTESIWYGFLGHLWVGGAFSTKGLQGVEVGVGREGAAIKWASS